MRLENGTCTVDRSSLNFPLSWIVINKDVRTKEIARRSRTTGTEVIQKCCVLIYAICNESQLAESVKNNRIKYLIYSITKIGHFKQKSFDSSMYSKFYINNPTENREC